MPSLSVNEDTSVFKLAMMLDVANENRWVLCFKTLFFQSHGRRMAGKVGQKEIFKKACASPKTDMRLFRAVDYQGLMLIYALKMLLLIGVIEQDDS